MPRVLIVDDEVDVLRATAKALKYAGYDTHSAGNAADALVLCGTHSFDVVILDVIMPGIKGLELLTRIRKIQPLVRSIIMSGKLTSGAQETDITASLRESVEADCYLHKPLTPTRLREVLGDLLSKDPESDWKAIALDMTRKTKQSLTSARLAEKRLQILRSGKK